MVNRKSDAGLFSTELAIMAPLIIFAFTAVVMFGARLSQAEMSVQVAVQRGARAATLESDIVSAQSRAEGVVEQNLAMLADVGCGATPPDVVVTMAVEAPDGGSADFKPGSLVVLRAKCRVQLADLVGVGVIPGEVSVEKQAAEIIDYYRAPSD